MVSGINRVSPSVYKPVAVNPAIKKSALSKPIIKPRSKYQDSFDPKNSSIIEINARRPDAEIPDVKRNRVGNEHKLEEKAKNISLQHDGFKPQNSNLRYNNPSLLTSFAINFHTQQAPQAVEVAPQNGKIIFNAVENQRKADALTDALLADLTIPKNTKNDFSVSSNGVKKSVEIDKVAKLPEQKSLHSDIAPSTPTRASELKKPELDPKFAHLARLRDTYQNSQRAS